MAYKYVERTAHVLGIVRTPYKVVQQPFELVNTFQDGSATCRQVAEVKSLSTPDNCSELRSSELIANGSWISTKRIIQTEISPGTACLGLRITAVIFSKLPLIYGVW